MAEYIEREALYEKAYWHGEMPDVGNPHAEGVEAVDINDVDAIPAADVAPVVRCEDCKRQEDCMKQLVFWERDHVLEQNVYQYHKLDFCSYGKRRAD